MRALGIDVGGSGIKGAPVDLDGGTLTAERLRVPTPERSTPRAVARAIGTIVRHFGWDGIAGCGFPGVVRDGVVLTAANVSNEWVGTDGGALLREVTKRSWKLLNDADAAGLAEARYGAGRDRRGVVLVLTFGTGIGSALVVDGELVPNFELGHLEMSGRVAEHWASKKARVDEGLSWPEWARRVNRFLARMEGHFWPELIIVGGGASKKFDRFAPYLETRCEIVPAALRNQAGIVGAALAAALASEATP